MKIDNLYLRYSLLTPVLLTGCLCLPPAAKCQQKQTPAGDAAASTKFPAAKAQPPRTASSDGDADSAEGSQDKDDKTEKDSPEAIRKREEWFYKQRASVNGHIPAGARLKALQHMQRMMAAEGKLVQRPDGSYATVTPQAGSTSFPAWSSIGPTPTTGGTFSPVTGRITAIAVDPSDTTGNTVLIGGAQGGIWRSTDAGVTWAAVGDQNASLAMGSIAFAPSQMGTVYAGTGEQASIGFDIYYGAGVLMSSDHGQTWTQTCTVAGPTCPFIGPYVNTLAPGFGFFNFGGAHISYVAVNPTNPNLILVGAQFIVEGPQEGVYCSSNGGATWTNILPDEMATFVGFASSTVAFAALGNPFGSSEGAPHGNGIYKSTNANSCSATFTALAGGLPPQTEMGRMDLGISPNYAADNTVYASIADDSTSSSTNLGVWLTTNGGTTWTLTAAPDVCQGQCWYDNVVKVDPNNKNIAFFGGAAVTDNSGNPIWVVRTTTGGTSWPTIIPNQLGPGLPHVDTHAMAFFKLSTNKVRMYLGNDGGIWRTDDAEAATITWTNLNDSLLTLTQFYPSISINTSSPSIAFAGTQDNGSQNYQGAVAWVDNNLCGDGASTAVDAQVPSTVYIGCATGYSVNASYQNGAVGTFSPAINGINPSDSSNFVPPLVSDPSTPNAVYFGTTKVYQSLDAGNTWTPLSNDLVSGADGDVLTALAVAPGNPSVLYAGGNNSGVYLATNVSAGSAMFNAVQSSLPPRSVTSIAVDPNDPTGLTAYVAYSGFAYFGTDPIGQSISDTQGHIFKTTNGASFVDVSCSVNSCVSPAATDLPNIPVNDVVVDPDVPGTIYAATDLGVFVGNCTAMPCTWSTLGTALPHVAVLSLRLHEASRTLFAATHGRGVWNIALNNFAFTGPRIFSLTPTSANAGAAQLTLTVTGTGLTGGTIMFGTTALTPTGTSSDTSLSGTIPSTLLTAASVQVTVTIPNPAPPVTSNAVPFSVLALTPTLASSNPPSTPVQTPPSPPLANIPIQLTGTNFATGAKVLFNGAYNGITSTFNSSTGLSATLPSALLGPYGSTNDVVVLNTPPGGGRSTPITFKVVAPLPVNDAFTNAISITALSYSDVKDSSAATTQSSDPTPPPSCVSQYSSAQGNTGGLPNGAYNTIWYQFTPTFSSNLEVDTIGSSYDTVLSIWTGTPGSLTSVACNDDINPGIVIQSQLSGVPLTSGTTYYIMVSSFGPPDPNPIALGGKSQLNFSYNSGVYPAPTLTSISPTSASSGAADLTLTLIGSGFFNGAGVDFVNSATSYGSLLATTFVSSTKLTAVIPASAIALPAAFNISVNNPFPNAGPSTALPFTINLGTYPVPNLTSIYPTTMVAGSLPFLIYAGGTEFAPGAVLNFNGVAKATTVTGTTNVSATISTADISVAGTVQVTVTNPTPGGGPSTPQPFVISQPTVVPNITSLNPSTVPGGLQTNLTVNGTGFTQGAQLDVVGPGAGFYSTSFISSTQLSLPNFAVGGVGTYSLYVVDPAPAGTSTVFMLTVTQPPPPSITSISPASAQTGSTPTLTITGTNFQPSASVMFNNESLGANVTSSNQLSVLLPLSGLSAGTYPLTVVNPVPTPTPSAPANFTVTGLPDFSFTVAAGQSTQTVNAGQTATFMNVIAVNALNGFTGQVAVSCTSPAQATTCSLNQNSLIAGQSATVMVTTEARSLAPLLPLKRRIISWPRLVPLLVVMLLCVLLVRLARTRRQRMLASLPLAGIILFLVLQAVGCGGGSSQPPPPPPVTGTLAGTYTITVTGISTNPAATHTATLQLIVN